MSERHPQWGQAVRLLTEADCTPELIGALSQMAARGFSASKLMCYFANGSGSVGIALYMQALIKVIIRYGWVTIICDYAHPERPVALALWLKPGATVVPLLAYARALPLIVQAAGWGVVRMLWDLWILEQKHAEVMAQDPHLYLVTVVTDPLFRGRGLSSLLLGPAWRWCDAGGYAAYLESDDSGPPIPERNSVRYMCYGFRSRGAVPVFQKTLRPQYLAMRRDPRKMLP